ncbi:MAG TPA: lysophospholipid acyltransferase family protein [Pyrinomonadaceae bacterium]|jgi:1-acyl-sn-glycerol-3-phosphate acyltransferase|nr:lysophospholipid acyltransferase family protein [Pyrinomonadaceae bacterium]
MPESTSYRRIVVASQYLLWVVAQILRLRYNVRAHRPAGLFEQDREHCLILASSHKTILDPWLIMIGLEYRHFRTLVPIRILATQTFVGRLKWLNLFKPLIKLMYRLGGVIELPPENDSIGFHPEKIRGLLVALAQGDVVAMFPEGEIWREREPPVGEFASGVIYLERRSGAWILPVAVLMSERLWPRRQYVVRFGGVTQTPKDLEFDSAAAWLRERVLELYQQIEKQVER